MFRLFSKDLLRYLPAQAVPALLAFVTIPLYTRFLSVEQFGQLALIKASVQIMGTLMSWPRPAIIRFYPAVAAQDMPVLARTALWAQLTLSCVVGAMVFGLNRVVTVNPTLQPLVDIGVLIFLCDSVFWLCAYILRARLQAGAYSLFTAWEEFASFGCGMVLCVGLRLGVAGILWGNVLGIVSALPLLGKMAYGTVRTIGPVSFPLLREMAWYGIPLMVGQLTGWALNYADRYQIHLFYSAREVGMYAAAYAISQHSITFLGTLIRLSSAPLLANAWEKQGQEASMRLLNAVTRVYLVVCIPMVIGMSVLAEPIIKVLAGAEFSESYSIVPWVAGGAFFLGLQHRFNQVLSLLKQTATIMVSLMVAGFLNIGLNWWLLPLFGYKSAAVTTLTCYILLCIVQTIASRRYLYWPFPWSTVMRSLGAAAVMSTVIYGFGAVIHLAPGWMLVCSIPLGIGVYSLCLWLAGEASLQERQAIQSYLRRRFIRTRDSARPELPINS